MNNDLISRSELKRKLNNFFGGKTIVEPAYILRDVFYYIDNAPTVPQDCSECKRFEFPYFEIKFDKEQMQELVDKAKAEVLASIERPQGKWGKWVISEIRCPICLEYFQTDCYSTEELNECPSCGADMRGGAV